MNQYFYVSIVRNGRVVFIGKCQCTREALDAHTASTLPNRRHRVEANGEVIIF